MIEFLIIVAFIFFSATICLLFLGWCENKFIVKFCDWINILFFLLVTTILLVTILLEVKDNAEKIKKFDEYIDKINHKPNDITLLNNFFDFTIKNLPTNDTKAKFNENAETAFEYYSISLMAMYRAYLIRENNIDKQYALDSIKKQLRNIQHKMYELERENDNAIYKQISGASQIYPPVILDISYFCALTKLEHKYRRLIKNDFDNNNSSTNIRIAIKYCMN